MSLLSKFANSIDALNRFVMYALGIVVMTLVINVFAVAILRYGWDYGEIWMQELYVTLHSAIFMLGIAYTLSVDEHVRIDLIYRVLGKKAKAFINLVGSIFVALPIIYFLAKSSYPFVARSWQILERSAEAGGLPALYLVKSMLLVLSLLLGLQILAVICKSIVTLFSPQNSNITQENDHV